MHRQRYDRVLTDAELQAEGLNPSYVRTALDRRLKLNFLRYSKIAMLSRVEEHLQDKIYDSPFLEEFAKLPENAERAKQWNKTRRQDIEIYYSFVGKVDLPE